MVSGRKTKAIDLFGEKLFLAERDAYEVLELQVFVRKNELDDDNLVYLLHAAKAIEAALKFNVRAIPLWMVRARLRVWRVCRAKYLLRHLQVREINDLFLQVLELENLDDSEKKKVSKSGGTSPKG